MFQKLIVVSAVASLSLIATRSSPAAVLASQGFETAPPANNWAYTLTSAGGNVSTTKGQYDSPEANARVIEGSRSFQQIPTAQTLQTSTLSFVPIATSPLGGNSVSIRLGAHAVGSVNGASANGLDTGDTVKVYIALDVPLGTAAGDVTYLPAADLTVEGNYNNRWSYNTGTATATANITQNAASRTPVYKQPGRALTNVPTDNTTDGYSTLILNLPDTATTFAMKIVAADNTTTEAWVIDNILVTTPEPASLGALAVVGGLLLRRRQGVR